MAFLFYPARHLRLLVMTLVISVASSGLAVSQDPTKSTDASQTSNDESGATDTEKSNDSGDTKEEGKDANAENAEQKDPLAVPEDATAEELFDFVARAKRSRGRTVASVLKSARAAAAGAAAIREIETITVEEEIRAIRDQLSALSFISRYSPEERKQREDIIAELKENSDPRIARMGAAEQIKALISAASTANEQEQREIISEFRSYQKGNEFDRESYSLASALCRSIGRSNVELAATLYEEVGEMMRDAEDEAIRSRAVGMIGAARRLRLPGNFMELTGTTAGGDEFDWSRFRGKVVLVDFWASWCGPCRAEVPNMKRNLDRFGEHGFEIVGVNLDRTLEACDTYVEREELPWVNLISPDEEKRGWDNPIARHYGISAIPTAILVDQEGKVVSLSARGSRLDTLLEDLLGDPDATEDKEESDEDPQSSLPESADQ